MSFGLRCGVERYRLWLSQDAWLDIPAWDKSHRTNGTFSREDIAYDKAADQYTCPGGHTLQRYRRKPRPPKVSKDGTIKYRAAKQTCTNCVLKIRCCPNQPARAVTRSVHEEARDVARAIRDTDAYMMSFIQRRKVEMLFAQLKRYIGLSIIRLRGPKGTAEQFQLAATAQNLRKLAKMIPQPARESVRDRSTPHRWPKLKSLFQHHQDELAAVGGLRLSVELVIPPKLNLPFRG